MTYSFILSFFSILLLGGSAVYATNPQGQGRPVYHLDQLKELESYGDPADAEHVANGKKINALCNKAKHPKDHAYGNLGFALKQLGREGQEDFYDTGMHIHALAKKARHPSQDE